MAASLAPSMGMQRDRSTEMTSVIKASEARDAARTPGAAEPKKSETDLPRAYVDYLEAMQKAWTDLPDLTITYQDFGYSVQVPVGSDEIPSVGSYYLDQLQSLNVFRDTSKEWKTFKPLQGASGVVRPGELTLVLAPPGHGKSMLLKGLAGRLQRESENLRGEIRWNGLDAKQSAEAGQQLTKMCAFVEQGDVHYPMLTVRETFQFALDNSNADTTLLGSPEFTAMQEKKVDLMLELLGLKECADTVVGNTMLRGVSGGQKKRVTLGEMMITQARALFLDEISTGLDSAATFDIASALKKWTRVMRGSAYVALLQPAPEVFEMFDNIILMREGCIVFSGTQAQLKQHFVDIKITPNPDIDFADWLTEFLADPPAVWQHDLEQRGRDSVAASFRKSVLSQSLEREPSLISVAAAAGMDEVRLEPIEAHHLAAVAPDDAEPHTVKLHLGEDESAPEASILPIANQLVAPHDSALVERVALPGTKRVKGLGQVVTASGIPLTTSALKMAYESSAAFQDIQTEMRDTAYTLEKKYLSGTDQMEPSAFTKAQFYQPQSWGVWHHTWTCLWRQWLFMLRSSEFVIPRILQAISQGLVIGSVYYQLSPIASHINSRIGLMQYSLIFLAFANMVEIPLASEFKLVVYKQVDSGFYPTFSYVFSVVLMHFPLAIIETLIFGSCIYWMSGFATDAGRFFFFLLILLGNNICIGVMFRFIAYLSHNASVASSLSGPVTGVMIIFGGFLITRQKIPNWLIEFYWLSPFSWGVRSNALNEFNDGRYAEGVGDTYLRSWQFQTDNAYKWAGFGYQWGLAVIFIVLGSIALKYKRTWLTTGTRRAETVEPEMDLAKLEVRVGGKTSSILAAIADHKLAEAGSRINLEKMDLTFINLKYSVPVFEKNDETGQFEHRERMLLTGINGYARAGELTALMGSSGAGKTTLMDVIAGRKTSGTITGDILINGHPQTFPSFNRLMGYCEQQDIHVGTSTVREAIEFSARLRLSSKITNEARQRFVDQILDDLELTPIANRLIGDVDIQGLSPGQLKLVTIGVELAANPAFLFLDEPTSGLDSRAALNVCRVIRKIARRGRAVVCTIHQPSTELFGMFDRLLLLKSGGREVYFGPVGEDGINVVEYFMNADIGPEFFRPQLPDKVNPASWMLDVIGAGTSAKGKIAEYNSVYVASPLRELNMSVVRQLSAPKAASPSTELGSIYAASYRTQLAAVLSRFWSIYWRDTSQMTTRLSLVLLFGFIFGFLYLDIGDDDQNGLTSKMSVVFMALAWNGLIHTSSIMPMVFKMREVLYRERASNCYASWLYSVCFTVVEIPYCFAASVLFTLPLYFLVGFENDASLFFKFLLAMYLVGLFYGVMGLFLASASPSMHVAQVVQGLIISFFIVFGGVYIQLGIMPIGWHFVYYLDPIPKGLVSITLNQYKQFDCVAGADGCFTFDSTTLGTVTKWEYVTNYLSSGSGWEDYYLAYLVLMIVVMVGFFALAVQKISHIKR